jgi:tetratricopeptide (TPR) repeat protein
VLVLAVLAVFGQTAGFAFVNIDDDKYVFQNPVVENGLTLKGVAWAFSYAGIGHWHPLTWLTHMLDCQLYGLWAGGHHLTNVALHAATTALLFLVLRQLTGRLWPCFFATALWAVHPLRVESVAWVAERKDVLSGLFFVLTLGAYIRYARRPSRGRYAMVAGLFALGLAAKDMLVTLPFVLLLLDWWPLGRLNHRSQCLRLLREKLPLFALSLVSCVITLLSPEKLPESGQIPFLDRLGNAAISYVVYLKQAVLPVDLAIPCLFPQNGPSFGAVVSALILLTAISIAVVAVRQRHPYLLVGWLWYLGMLVPVIGLMQISYYAHADRYTYLPQIGLNIALAWTVADATAQWKHRRTLLGALMTLAIGACAAGAAIQTSYWKDSISLWTHSLACDPGNFLAHDNLGNALADQGHARQAIIQYRQALAIAPNFDMGHYNLAIALLQIGAVDEAIAHFQKSLEIRPGYLKAEIALGNTLAQNGRLPQAVALYQQILATAPDSAETHNNLGVAFFMQGRPAEAVAQYRQALQIDPNYAEARNNLGFALAGIGQWPEAIAQYRQALAINPGYAKAHTNLGDALRHQGQWDEAIAEYLKALEIQPDYAEACCNVALLLAQQGRFAEAITQYAKAVELMPGNPLIENNLAWLLATCPDTALRNGPKAVMLAQQASQLSGGNNPTILHTLAAAYAAAGQIPEATQTTRQALNFALAQNNRNLAATLRRELDSYQNSIPQPPSGNKP